MTPLKEAVERVEEALRLAEVGEYLYSARAYSYGNGYDEPREYGIDWQWQQSKPNEYGQGVLLAEAVAWHREQAEDGAETEASKLRAYIARLTALLDEAAGALAWALPLAEIATETHRIDRLRSGHDDIGAAEGHIGLWPQEFADRQRARTTLAKLREPSPTTRAGASEGASGNVETRGES